MRRFALLIVLLGCAPAADGPTASSGVPRDEGTRRMVERLEALHETPFLDQHPFRNAEKAERLAALEQPSGSTSLRSHHFRLGREFLWAGRTEQAIGHFEEMLRLAAEEPELRRRAKEWLAIAYLRHGEQQNCIDRHGSASCILPIEGGGIHVRKEPSAKALQLFGELLAEEPDDITTRWLLNLAAMTLGEYPEGVDEDTRLSLAALGSEDAIERFVDTAPQRGLDVVGLAGGVAVEDFNGDGRLDVLASSWGVRDPLSLRLSRADGSFEEVAPEAGLEGLTGGLQVAPADFDNDGDIDVLVLRGAWTGALGNYPNSLLANDGQGRFVDVTESAGVLDFFPTQSAAWGDYDNDGDLDLFVAAEAVATPSLRSRLYRNRGDGTFERVGMDEGAAVTGFVKGAVWGDYDNDGWLDLYVSRLGADNVLLHNGGPGANPRFTDRAAQAGVTEPHDSFPTWFFDFDNDGWEDLFVGSFPQDYANAAADSMIREALGERPEVSVPRLYRNRGDGTFEDVTEPRGLWRSLLAMGASFGDLDNDGWLDLYVGTGAPSYRALVPNRMFRNLAGREFRDVTAAGGFGHLQKGHGVSFADLDADGDQDVLAVMGGAFSGDVYANALFENPGNDNDWVVLRLVGTDANRSALGARVRVSFGGADGPREIHRTVNTGGSFGGNSLQLEIGLGRAQPDLTVEVRWPGGDSQTFEVEANGRYELVEGEDAARRLG